MTSLRKRAILGGALWALVSTVLGSLALLTILDRMATRRFDELQLERHLQVVVALANGEADPDVMEILLPDPAYTRPYSGRYWQVTGPDGNVISSRSLFDASLPVNVPSTTGPEFWSGAGPEGEVRGVVQEVKLEDDTAWVITVAESLSALDEERVALFRSVTVAMAFIGSLMVAGAVLLTSAVVSPLTKLREEVAHRWEAGRALDVNDYPAEVTPLVSDINTLLMRNREVLDRARRQAADLAHALKTPSAALRNELESFDVRKVDVEPALDALNRIDAQIGRSLARMRAAHSASAVLLQTDLGVSVDRLLRLFRSMNADEAKQIEATVEPGLGVAMDSQDIEETLGNLIDNAVKWSRSRIRLTARLEAGRLVVLVEDDGPGIPEERRRLAIQAGARLDTATPGTGLGLAIANDLVVAYGGSLALETSDNLGGLAVRLSLPPAELDEAVADPLEELRVAS